MAGTMWWGGTTWWPMQDVSTQWQSGWLNLQGTQFGPGGHGGGTFTWDEKTYSHDMKADFWMSPSRMPPSNYGSYTFTSQPLFEIRGKVSGDTFISSMAIDHPDLTCRLKLEQAAYYNNNRFAHNKNKRVLFDLPEKANHQEQKHFKPHPRRYDFPNITFPIRRNETLHIELKASIELYLEGYAHMRFHPNFEIRTPQWDIW